MERLAVDIDPACEMDYYKVHSICGNNPSNIQNSYSINSRLNLTLDFFQLMAVI